jgi:hypothetical protein
MKNERTIVEINTRICIEELLESVCDRLMNITDVAPGIKLTSYEGDDYLRATGINVAIFRENSENNELINSANDLFFYNSEHIL